MPLTVAGFPLCRAHDLFHPLEEYPAALKRNPAAEVYWFNWRSDGSLRNTTIRIARIGTDVMVTRLHLGSSMFGKSRCLNGRLTMSDWAQVEDAVVAARFWLLDERDYLGDIATFGGADWIIAGRRRHDQHVVQR
jgi:hypothetical protein